MIKKIVVLCVTVLVLAGCSNENINDSYSAYRDQTASELYQHASVDLHKKHYDKAVKLLEALNALYPFGVYEQEGQVNLMYAYYKNDAPEESLAVADRYIRLYPDGKYIDYVYYLKGVVASNQGLNWLQRKLGVSPATRDDANLKQAFLSFGALLKLHPHSKYAADALVRMRYIRNVLADRQLKIAQYYFEEKAYVAAANRAQEVVTHYDRTPSVIPALAILVKSYRLLGLHRMAEDTMSVFAASYPDSPVLKNLSH